MTALADGAAAGLTLYELPHRHTLRTDGEAVRACAGWPRACWSGAPSRACCHPRMTRGGGGAVPRRCHCRGYPTETSSKRTPP